MSGGGSRRLGDDGERSTETLARADRVRVRTIGSDICAIGSDIYTIGCDICATGYDRCATDREAGGIGPDFTTIGRDICAIDGSIWPID